MVATWFRIQSLFLTLPSVLMGAVFLDEVETEDGGELDQAAGVQLEARQIEEDHVVVVSLDATYEAVDEELGHGQSLVVEHGDLHGE